MFTKTLLPDTVRAIELVSGVSIVQKAYLAGGTALALHLGHRISVDLDFFTKEEFSERLLSTGLGSLPEFKEEGKAWRTVWGKVSETKFSIFYYKYPLLEQTTEFMGINLMSIKDIAAMKILALSDRGTKRDFVDLFFLNKLYSFDEMFDFYDQKYGDLTDKSYHIIRSFDYFIDAEVDQMPNMLINTSWEEIKELFHKESLRLSKLILQ